MIISEFDRNNPVLKDQLSDLLRLTWPEEYGDSSAEEVELPTKEPNRYSISQLLRKRSSFQRRNHDLFRYG